MMNMKKISKTAQLKNKMVNFWIDEAKKEVDYWNQVWNFDISLSEWILPRLKYFKKVNIGYPEELGFEKFNEILDKMILSFELIQSKDLYLDAEKEKQIEEGLFLFAKYFRSLWI